MSKSAVILVSILFTALFSTLFFTGCEDSLLTVPAMSESVGPESPMPESPMPEDPGIFSLAKGKPASDTCLTIQSGGIPYSTGHYLAGQSLQVGYDVFGYNYQAHLFNGSYANVYLGRDGFPPYEGDSMAYLAENPGAENHWTWPYRDVQLGMKWNDAWLSNKDCDENGLLDRHYGYDSYIGSGAWETNHQSGVNPDSSHWTYFIKIVAAPADANLVDGVWCTADGVEIGPVIWDAYAIIQQVSNDPSLDEHGLLSKSPASPGFGFYKP